MLALSEPVKLSSLATVVVNICDGQKNALSLTFAGWYVFVRMFDRGRGAFRDARYNPASRKDNLNLQPRLVLPHLISTCLRKG